MQIFLKNESHTPITVRLDETRYHLAPNEGKHAFISEASAVLCVSPDAEYRCDPVTGKIGLSYFHRFVVEAEYSLTAKNGSEIRFYSETAHGNNFESYNRAYPFCPDCELSAPFYTVRKEKEIKEKIAKSDKTETVLLQGAGVAGKLIKAKNTFDDIVAGIIVGIIALIIFVLIWVFKSFRFAALIYGSVALIGLLVWKLFLEKALEKAKRKAKKKTEEKFGKMFLPCENMPEGIFKGKDSYFAHDYIAAVFEHSSKRV